MKKLSLINICLLLLLTACSYPTREQWVWSSDSQFKQMPPKDFIPQNISVVAIGDSLTAGVGDTERHGGYIPYLKDQLQTEKSIKNAEFLNFGVKGNRTDQLLVRLKQQDVKSSIEKSDFVIITIGGNDIMQVFKENLTGLKLSVFMEAEAGFKTRLKEIISTITSYNSTAEIILLGVYNPFIRWFSDLKEMDEIVNRWNLAFQDVVVQFPQANYVAIDDIFKNNEESLMYTDYFHPNSQGYELIAKRIYTHMKEEGLLKKIVE